MIRLCTGDLLLDTIRETFEANPVRIPEERLQPLVILGKIKSKSYFLGNVNNFEKLNNTKKAPKINRSKLANVTNKKTKEVNLDVGINILEGFLSGFGINAKLFGEIKTCLNGVKSLSFSFDDVVRLYVEPIEVSNWLLENNTFLKSQAIIPFSEEGKDLYIIDSVITSKSLSINIESKSDNNFIANIPTIQNILSSTDIKIETSLTNQTGITFKGDKSLTFAFSCLSLYWDKSKTLISILPNTELVNLGLGENKDIYYPTDKAILYNDPVLIEWSN